MRLYIRFTDTIESDINRGTSIITHDRNGIEITPTVVDGLCVFGYYESFEDCHERASVLHSILGGTKNYAILRGVRTEDEGSMGCVITAVELVSKHAL